MDQINMKIYTYGSQLSVVIDLIKTKDLRYCSENESNRDIFIASKILEKMLSISGLAANYFQLIPDPCTNGFIQQDIALLRKILLMKF